jgi:hypothetical protein
MFCKAMKSAGKLLLFAAAAFLVSCATTHHTSSQIVNVTVKGPADELKVFDSVFRDLVGSEQIGCAVDVEGRPYDDVKGQVSDCVSLREGTLPPNSFLVYRFRAEHTWVFEKLGIAFNKASGGSSIVLSISHAPQTTSGQCAGYTSPCNPNPMCPNYGDCSQSKVCVPCVK